MENDTGPEQNGLYRSVHLETGTSARAEVAGMMTALALFLEHEPNDDAPLFLFTDNRAAISVATCVKTPWWCREEAEVLRADLQTIAERRRIVCFWVPGHGGVYGNEVVDRLARRGATGEDGEIRDEGVTPEDKLDIPKENLVTEIVRSVHKVPLMINPRTIDTGGKGNYKTSEFDKRQFGDPAEPV